MLRAGALSGPSFAQEVARGQPTALVAASVAAEQARRLIVEGIEELHFYTLNRAELTIAACRLLGLRPSLACAA